MQHGRYPEVPDDFGHWLAGFTDGEGCFRIARQGHSAHAWLCQFQLGLRLDDRAILDEISQRTGLGHVDVRQGSRHMRPGAKDRAIYRVVAKREARRLVELFDRFPLRAKKAGDYAIWREAVLLWQPVKHGVQNDWRQIAALAEELKAAREYDAPLVLFASRTAAIDAPRLFDR